MKNLRTAIPMLHVDDMEQATAFYCEKLGFEKTSEYRVDDSKANPAYVVIARDELWFHLSSFSGDGKPGGVAVLFVRDVSALYKEYKQQGVNVGMSPVDQTWGNKEMYLDDPFGNQLRFTQPLEKE
ncbi:MAG: VOC family protein [Rhodothermaceae bacterium]|nr:VOC family protein [Rhodothermaceae bacterium]